MGFRQVFGSGSTTNQRFITERKYYISVNATQIITCDNPIYLTLCIEEKIYQIIFSNDFLPHLTARICCIIGMKYERNSVIC